MLSFYLFKQVLGKGMSRATAFTLLSLIIMGHASGLYAAESSLCGDRLFLPQVNLPDGSAYAAWLLREGNEFVLEREAKLIAAPEVMEINQAEYDNGRLKLTSVWYSQGSETQAFQAELSHIIDTEPMRFYLEQVALGMPLETSVQHACVNSFLRPQAVKIDGKYHTRYELLLQEVNGVDKTIEKIEIWEQSQLLVEYSGEALTELLSGYGENQTAFAFITLQTESIPTRIDNRVSIRNGSSSSLEVRQYVVELDDTAVTRIASPVKDGVWYFAELGAHEHHAKFLDFEYAHPVNSQRWAVDLLKVWLEDESVCREDCSRNEQFATYAQPFYAVADGTVVAVYDGVVDNLPGQVPEDLSSQEHAGNYILQDLGEGIYALYAHAQPNSLLVKVGEQLTQGQPLGHIGNSGNSTAPHLHFHLVELKMDELKDNLQVFNGEGVPFTFEQFMQLDPLPGIRTQEMPADDSILLFE